MLKQCIDCPTGHLKDTSEFYVSRKGRTRDGFAPVCREHKRERDRQWQAANRERNKDKCRARYHANKEEYLARNATRRFREMNQFIEDVDRRVVFEMHGGMCGICKEFIEGDFHVDHVIPISKGGMHGYVNVQPAHPLCNMKKGARI